MKNKITKLFLALLAITLSNNVNAQVETRPMSKKVQEATNVEFLKEFAKKKNEEYEKAVQIAKSRGRSVEEIRDGKKIALAGYNEETGELIYITTYNNSPTKSSLATANAKPLHSRGIAGAGMNVGVWDGGVGLTNHLGFSGGRYVIKQNASLDDHAAHVAGTVAAGEFGTFVAKGFAYNAKIYAYDYHNDISEMTLAATNTIDPIYLSNHSYGYDYVGNNGPESILGQYNARVRDYDVLANNVPYYTMVVAAGNDRNKSNIPAKAGGKDLLTGSSVAKNTVVVAATQGTDDFSGITGPTSVINVGGVGPFMSSFSSYGPTDDFRIKPDISAKGVDVTSVGIEGPASIANMQGTSMAAPAVTGVFALWQSYYDQLNGDYMRSASVRALMAHTAREAGPAPGPDFMFGWGLIDAAKGVDIIDKAELNTALFRELELPQGSTFEYEFPYDGVEPLVATIAWNDPAGTVSSLPDLMLPKLVNDLDLRIINIATNQVYYPWSLTPNWNIGPTAGNISVRNVDNIRDNIEKVEPQGVVPPGIYKVVVNHKGTLQGGTQFYTLIISGAGGTMPPTDGVASVEDIILNDLTIYPNPVDSSLNITGDLQTLNNAKINIYDISGKKVKDITLNFESNNAVIDVSALQTGTYILTVSKNGAKQSYKFIKK